MTNERKHARVITFFESDEVAVEALKGKVFELTERQAFEQASQFIHELHADDPDFEIDRIEANGQLWLGLRWTHDESPATEAEARKFGVDGEVGPIAWQHVRDGDSPGAVLFWTYVVKWRVGSEAERDG